MIAESNPAVVALDVKEIPIAEATIVMQSYSLFAFLVIRIMS